MKVGICFSGGGIKGAAHIGVLKALEEENIDFNYISGTSSGSIIATLYSMGYNSDEIYELFKKYSKKVNYMDFRNILKLTYGLIVKRKIIITGLNSGYIIEKIINKVAMEKNITNINQVKKTLIIPSVNLKNGEINIFSSKQGRATYMDNINYIYEENIGTIVRSSCSYPGIFSPVIYKDKYLIDGGIRENIPWKELKSIGAEKVISIVFDSTIKEKEEINIFDSVAGAIQILCHELSNYELEGADYLLKIKTKDISLLDTSRMDELYDLGYNQAKLEMENIKELVNSTIKK